MNFFCKTALEHRLYLEIVTVSSVITITLYPIGILLIYYSLDFNMCSFNLLHFICVFVRFCFVDRITARCYSVLKLTTGKYFSAIIILHFNHTNKYYNKEFDTV